MTLLSLPTILDLRGPPCELRVSVLIRTSETTVAYLTTTILEQESTWFFTAWQPQIASSAAFDTWIGTVVNRAANHTQWRVGAALYGTANLVIQGVLQEAELCLAQYYLCLASAA